MAESPTQIQGMNIGTDGRKKRQVNTFSLLILTFFLGMLGAHKFYTGKNKTGLVYGLFSWTLIPPIIAFVEFIIYFFTFLIDKDKLRKKYTAVRSWWESAAISIALLVLLSVIVSILLPQYQRYERRFELFRLTGTKQGEPVKLAKALQVAIKAKYGRWGPTNMTCNSTVCYLVDVDPQALAPSVHASVLADGTIRIGGKPNTYSRDDQWEIVLKPYLGELSADLSKSRGSGEIGWRCEDRLCTEMFKEFDQ